MPDFAPLTERWRQAEWSASEWSAILPCFANKDNSIVISLEGLANGACEWTIAGAGGQIGQDIAPSKEAAANAAISALRHHFWARHKSPQYVLSFLPWTTDRQLKAAFDSTITAVGLWRNGKRPMGKGSISVACRLMGIKGYARGGGEIMKLETPYWETPEYCMSPIHVDYRTGKAGRKPGAAWHGKNPKKKVDTPEEV